MSKRTISVPDATWAEMISRAGRIGLDRDGRALSVSAYIRELHEQSTRADAQPSGKSTKDDRLCRRQGCYRIVVANGYCSASHSIADEQEKRHG